MTMVSDCLAAMAQVWLDVVDLEGDRDKRIKREMM